MILNSTAQYFHTYNLNNDLGIFAINLPLMCKSNTHTSLVIYWYTTTYVSTMYLLIPSGENVITEMGRVNPQ